MKIEDKIETFNSLLKRRGFIWGPSPEIYGGLAGFYSFGPAGTALKNEILINFRRELRSYGFGEVECPTIMPEIVWKASGHLERFIDPVLKCEKCGSLFRADKYLSDVFPSKMVEGMSIEKMEEIIKKESIKCPKCETQFNKIEKYNLMLKTNLGIDDVAYLRPETATTTYLLFNRLDQDARRQYPVKVFQYGKAYRNEISPRQQVLRMRAFDQFEIQLFIGKEQELDFDEFEEVKNVELPLLDWKSQEKQIEHPKMISLKNALSKGMLKKEAYAYCLFLSYHLTQILGFPNEVMRYRQHSPDERAHYADDAWDLEINTNQFGWVEICGIHDRTNYDLKRHGEYSNTNFEIAMGKDPKVKEVPQILEIAFGLDRIIYTLLENAFNVDETKEGSKTQKRIVLQLAPRLAPNTVAVFPLKRNEESIRLLATKIHKSLMYSKINSFYDEKGAIGKLYRRQDELGTPFCITVDFQSLEDNTVTIRYRDSMQQERIAISEIAEIIIEKTR
jgi:glycyl-tRNA synthetase